jgi:hypothetical protein
VSWITLLGPDFAGQIDPSSLERARTLGLGVGPLGEGGLVIQAGAAPDTGDKNRFGIPRLYVAADQLVRSMRAADAERDEIVFVGPWDYGAVTEWLKRFEVRLWTS